MNKHEFITKLNGKLFLLNESERRDIIDEYIGHIELKMQDGKSEADAIRDFGDIDALADEILEAYHIDNSRAKTKNIDMYIRQGVDYISKATERILSFSSREMARVAVEFVLVLLVISILRLPFSMVAGLLISFFGWLPKYLYVPIRSIVDLTASLACLGLGLLIIYNFINKRILGVTPSFTQQSVNRNFQKSQPSKAQQPASATQVQEPVYNDEFVNKGFADTQAPSFEMPQQDSFTKNADFESKGSYSDYEVNQTYSAQENYSNQYPQKSSSAGDFVINLLVGALKILLFISVWVPSAIVTIVGIVCTVLAFIVYFSTGIGFIGICIAGIGCCVIGISFTAWLTEFIMGGKKDEKI